MSSDSENESGPLFPEGQTGVSTDSRNRQCSGEVSTFEAAYAAGRNPRLHREDCFPAPLSQRKSRKLLEKDQRIFLFAPAGSASLFPPISLAIKSHGGSIFRLIFIWVLFLERQMVYRFYSIEIPKVGIDGKPAAAGLNGRLPFTLL